MTLNDYDYIYLHGFASSPESGKAQFYKNKFNQYEINIHIPDLNNNDFTHLTLSRQLSQVQQIINNCTKPIILIGSSMGGLTSCILAETNKNIAKIILLAPAFKMSQLWKDALTHEQILKWQTDGNQNVFHYAYEKEVPLHYEFYVDLFIHNDYNFKRKLPGLIFHGKHDLVVPIQLSEEYVYINPNAELIHLEDDHSVNKHLEQMWDMSADFILTSVPAIP